ncbi:MAG: hypothetical protein A3J83_03480 [Elusimicrobia bacterium RIFOXYA2_FULL_40_6]|nr:MAG: hypothetical protein A3J83_03480 [Elusimicrobia bacterium RIFOXYA2_FULL_40_6]
MGQEKKLYTTSEVSQICNMSLSTVINCANEGKLVTFETPGGHRRIKREDLLDFLKRYNMPIPPELIVTSVNKILIVDDDKLILSILSDYIKKNIPNSEIYTAVNGFEAGSKIASLKPKLVILDIFLPGMDGFEVCKNVKNSAETKNIKIITITAQDKTEHRKKIILCGTDEHLIKPLDMNKLKEKIMQLLEIKNAAGVI